MKKDEEMALISLSPRELLEALCNVRTIYECLPELLREPRHRFINEAATGRRHKGHRFRHVFRQLFWVTNHGAR